MCMSMSMSMSIYIYIYIYLAADGRWSGGTEACCGIRQLIIYIYIYIHNYILI